MATARLDATYIGQVGRKGIYRVDLTQSGFASIGALTIHDDNMLSGGSGSHSGLDLDFVKVLSSATGDAASVLNLSGQAVFDFTSTGVAFQPGFQSPPEPGDPDEWNTNLQGTSGGNVYDPDRATLGLADEKELSLGEGGQVTFRFKGGLSTDGRYFYFGDDGGNNEGAYVLVSDVAAQAPTAFTLIGTSGNDTFRLGVGINEHLKFTDTTVYGRRGDDKIYGAFGDDKLYGEAGKDLLSGGSESDRVYGGSGNDKVSGGSGDDRVYGGSGNDKIHGDAGKDWVYGGSGDDRVNGGAGNDILYGNTGWDTFVFNTRLGSASTDRNVNFDAIKDFNARYDSFWLDNAVFRKIGSGTASNPGQLNKEFFVTDSKAREQDDYLIYDKKTGVLSYDADGSGSKQAVEFAQLSKNLSLTHKDFFVI